MPSSFPLKIQQLGCSGDGGPPVTSDSAPAPTRDRTPEMRLWSCLRGLRGRLRGLVTLALEQTDDPAGGGPHQARADWSPVPTPRASRGSYAWSLASLSLCRCCGPLAAAGAVVALGHGDERRLVAAQFVANDTDGRFPEPIVEVGAEVHGLDLVLSTTIPVTVAHPHPPRRGQTRAPHLAQTIPSPSGSSLQPPLVPGAAPSRVRPLLMRAIRMPLSPR